jgi:hypothetical protein
MRCRNSIIAAVPFLLCGTVFAQAPDPAAACAQLKQLQVPGIQELAGIGRPNNPPNCPPRSKVAAGFVRSYTAGMATNAATHPSPAPSSACQAADSRPALAPVIEINVRHIGRTPQPEKLTGSEAPEGWIKRIDRPREGKVWVGFFHLYVADRR